MMTRAFFSYRKSTDCLCLIQEGLEYFHFNKPHPYFKSVIQELNRIIKCKVAIIDGLYGLNKIGPSRGQPTLLNWLLVSNNIGAAARLCCELMQITLASVPHLKYAEKMGWIPQREEIQVNQ